MKKTLLFTVSILLAFSLIYIVSANEEKSKEQQLKSIELPKPQTEGGRPLMQVLKDRHSSRQYSPEKLPPQELSNLLWAAFGINRPDSGKRTAPSARNWQEIDIYVATTDGLYLYQAKPHTLKPVLTKDVRAATGGQSFVTAAPVNLIFVADLSKMGGSEQDKITTSAADTGFIGQNVYLYCASEGLATVIRGSVKKAELRDIMKLRSEQRIVLAQTVGYPQK
jgi:SagB-type dehydrogenase family enzyme